MLAAVEDAHHVRVLEAGGRAAPRAGSAPRTPGPGRSGGAAPSARPCGRGACPRRSRRRPSRPSRSGARSCSGRRPPCCSAISVIRRLQQHLDHALRDRRGDRAALDRSVRSTVTAIAIRGSSIGAKPMNHGWLTRGCADLGRAGLAGHLDALRARPPCRCPPRPRWPSSAVELRGGLRLHHLRLLARADPLARRARPCARSGRSGAAASGVPPFATAAATSAICSGVT